MKTWQYVWRLWLFRPGLLVVNTVLWLLLMLVPIGTGLILQRFFDTISGSAPAGLTPWTLLALFLGMELASLVNDFLRQFTSVAMEFRIGSLLRKNVFWQILQQPGARALPDSPGEALSRVRGDTGEIMANIWWPVALLGQIVSAIIALAIMARINPWITLIVFVPVLGTVALTQAGRTRIEQYPPGQSHGQRHDLGLSG